MWSIETYPAHKSTDIGFLPVTTQTQRYLAAYISGCETQDHIHHELEDRTALRQRVSDQEEIMRGFKSSARGRFRQRHRQMHTPRTWIWQRCSSSCIQRYLVRGLWLETLATQEATKMSVDRLRQPVELQNSTETLGPSLQGITGCELSANKPTNKQSNK